MIYAENILICIAVPLVISLWFVRRGARMFVASFLTGMLVCLLAAYISGFIIAAGGFLEEEAAIFISPVIEEIMKWLPLVLYLFLLEPENEGIILAAVGIGAGFATFENCCYILTIGAESFAYIMIRGFAVGVMHIVSIFALGMGLVLARQFRVLSFSSVIGALSLSMSFHALYNLLVSQPGASTTIGYSLPLLAACLLYILYRRIQKNAAGDV